MQNEASEKQALALEWQLKSHVDNLTVNSGPVYSAQTPGKWAGKDQKHVPQITISSDGTSSATVVVPHGMASDHW
jgi:hypothetical protein